MAAVAAPSQGAAQEGVLTVAMSGFPSRLKSAATMPWALGAGVVMAEENRPLPTLRSTVSAAWVSVATVRSRRPVPFTSPAISTLGKLGMLYWVAEENC